MFLNNSRHGDRKAISYIVFLALWRNLSIKSLSKCLFLSNGEWGMMNTLCVKVWDSSCLQFFVMGVTPWHFPPSWFHIQWSYCCSNLVSATIYRRAHFTADFLVFWVLRSIFPVPLQYCSLSHRCRSYGVDLCVGLGATWSVALTPCPIEEFCDHMTVGMES